MIVAVNVPVAVNCPSVARTWSGMTAREDPVFLSTLFVEAAHLPGLEADARGARILRSVLMKPEHEPAVEWLATRVEALARATR